MGIYVFKKDVLIDLLNNKFPTANDFGGEIIPSAAKSMNVVAYPFYGYWEDIGTIKSFFDENLKLCRQVGVKRSTYEAIHISSSGIHTSRLMISGQTDFTSI